jgi:hypothetical protein
MKQYIIQPHIFNFQFINIFSATLKIFPYASPKYEIFFTTKHADYDFPMFSVCADRMIQLFTIHCKFYYLNFTNACSQKYTR